MIGCSGLTILARDDHERWLADDQKSAELLRPYPTDEMEAYALARWQSWREPAFVTDQDPA